MLLPYGAKLPAFTRHGECSRAARDAMTKAGHRVSLWLRLTLTNVSHGNDASALFVSDLRAGERRAEKPVGGVQLTCPAPGSGGSGVSYLAAIRLDHSDRATVADDAESEASGREFAATVSLPPGESAEFVLHVSAAESDYSFVLLADVYCGGCERSEVQFAGHKRLRVYSVAAAADYELSPAGAQPRTAKAQSFDVWPVGEGPGSFGPADAGGELGESPFKLALSKVPRESDEAGILRKLEQALGG